MLTQPEDIQHILQCALDNGATKAAFLAPDEVIVENRLAGFCKEPKCPFYGQSMSCPPNVSGPVGLRRKLEVSKYILVIRLEVDAASLLGEERFQVFAILQKIVADTECYAKSLGFPSSEGFAGGSCKGSLCHEHNYCEVLSGSGNCRNPDNARPSMSGYGVNVGKLMRSAGWSSDLFSHTSNQDNQMMWLAGMVLIK